MTPAAKLDAVDYALEPLRVLPPDIANDVELNDALDVVRGRVNCLVAADRQRALLVLRDLIGRVRPEWSDADVRTTVATFAREGRLAVVAMPQAITVRLATVQPERVSWLWSARIPRGKITVIDGDPGLGKSMLTLDLAARVSRGDAMPDGTCSGSAVGGVVLLSAEDDLADTIRPRLDAAGADCERVIALSSVREGDRERTPAIDDLGALAAAIAEVDAQLVVIDPIMAYLPSGSDSHRDQDVRSLLAPLAQLASATRAAIVVVRHLNKRSGGNPLYRGGGSIGIVGAARSGLLVARDPDDESGARRIVACTKSNLAAEAPALAYTIDSSGVAPRIVWHGATTHTAAQLVVEQQADDRGALTEAREWLADALEAGPRIVKDVQRAAREAGVADMTLRRARESLGVRPRKVGSGASQRWLWALPEMLTTDEHLRVNASQLVEIDQESGASSPRRSSAAPEHLSSDIDPEEML
jgi:hypothetical protein